MRGLCALVMAWSTAALSAEKTLWLVRPLYPGQEQLVSRTEQALDRLIPAGERADEVIGIKELGAGLKPSLTKTTPLPCFTLDERCADPINAFVASLGFDRVVLVQGGQDEAGFKFRVVSYRPGTGEQAAATSTNAVLEKALLGAVAKVVPVASQLEVTSEPAGATVFVDDVKVGVTPVTAQVLPGERTIRVDLKLHQPAEENVVIPIRGTARLTKALERVAARIVITASPPGTSIAVDGTVLGKDKVDRGIDPGKHVIRLSIEGYKAFEQSVEVKTGDQYVLDKTLDPIGGPVAANPNPQVITMVVKDGQMVSVPTKPQTETEKNWDRRTYFQGGFIFDRLESNGLVSRRFGSNGNGRTETITTGARSVIGAHLEFGIGGKYVGLAAIGLRYQTFVDPLALTVGCDLENDKCVRDGAGTLISPERQDGVQLGTELTNVSAHFLTISAIHPQFRWVVWRFQFHLQVGLDVRLGWVTDNNPDVTTRYKDGFLITDLLLNGGGGVRFYIVDGFYLFGAGHYAWYLTGWQTSTPGRRGSGSVGAEGGFGYAF